MSEVKKYYWIKLKTDFFNRDEIDFLLSQDNGCEYIVLYQMLCLMVANTNGKLVKEMNEIIIPYDIKKIVRDTKYFSFDTVTIALELYKKLGLVYADDNGCLSIADYSDMVGSETEYAQKKRIYREKQKLLEQSKDNVQDKNETLSEKSIEIRDKSIEYRDKIIDKDIDKSKKETFLSVIDAYTLNEDLKDALKGYIEMRKLLKGFTVRALKLNLNELDKLAIDDLTKIEIVNQSIDKSWKSFYPLKKQNHNNSERAF